MYIQPPSFTIVNKTKMNALTFEISAAGDLLENSTSHQHVKKLCNNDSKRKQLSFSFRTVNSAILR